VRIVTTRVSTDATFDVQINVRTLPLAEGRSYSIRFQARADASRSICVGIAQGHDPWLNLGWYEEIELVPEWRYIQREFIATADEDRARVHFDVGGSPIAVELSELNLQSVNTQLNFV
jgi:carbohydrate binding protein with CBM4/9 domain